MSKGRWRKEANSVMRMHDQNVRITFYGLNDIIFQGGLALLFFSSFVFFLFFFFHGLRMRVLRSIEKWS